MAVVGDLFDPQHTELFDALAELTQLQGLNITVPQLVVVGDQSSGKSTVLEALVRENFPTSRRVCTRFPTKLHFRRAAAEMARARIEPGTPSVLKSGTPHPLLFDGANEKVPLDLGSIVQKAHREFATVTSTDSLSNISSAPKFTDFTGDVLVVEKRGPEMPLVSLVDLPGLYASSSPEQTSSDAEKVRQIVRHYMESPRSVILLVVTAAIPFVNSLASTLIPDLANVDDMLTGRLLGVATHPDSVDKLESGHTEIRELFAKPKALYNVDIGWHVVCNHGKEGEHAARDDFAQRDAKEEKYFQNNWSDEIPPAHRGIPALRSTLKDMLASNLKKTLPGLVVEIQQKLADVNQKLYECKSRHDDYSRVVYLTKIAARFEFLVRNAVIGRYKNEECPPTHLQVVGQACTICRAFFPVEFHDHDDTSDEDRQDNAAKRLRSTIRLLNKEFAAAMKQCGKTEVFRDQVDDNNDRRAHSPASRPGRDTGLLHASLVKTYYQHPKAIIVSRDDYEKRVARTLDNARGLEFNGEVGPTASADLFQYQSKRWEAIAGKHLKAVCMVVQRLIRLAVQHVCRDEVVQERLFDLVIQPRMQEIQSAAQNMLTIVLKSHQGDGSAFHDTVLALIGSAEAVRASIFTRHFKYSNARHDPPPSDDDASSTVSSDRGRGRADRPNRVSSPSARPHHHARGQVSSGLVETALEAMMTYYPPLRLFSPIIVPVACQLAGAYVSEAHGKDESRIFDPTKQEPLHPFPPDLSKLLEVQRAVENIETYYEVSRWSITKKR